MARWSHAMKFDRESLRYYRLYLEKHGVYELGFVRKDGFYPKYVGKAQSQTLYKRLCQYFYMSKADKIPPGLRDHIHFHVRNMVWFHVFETADPSEAAGESHMTLAV